MRLPGIARAERVPYRVLAMDAPYFDSSPLTNDRRGHPRASARRPTFSLGVEEEELLLVDPDRVRARAQRDGGAEWTKRSAMQPGLAGCLTGDLESDHRRVTMTQGH